MSSEPCGTAFASITDPLPNYDAGDRCAADSIMVTPRAATSPTRITSFGTIIPHWTNWQPRPLRRRGRLGEPDFALVLAVDV